MAQKDGKLQRSNGRTKKLLQGVVSAAFIAAIFGFALPRIADFSDVWVEISAMTPVELLTLMGVALWNIATYWAVMVASLPGLNHWQAMKVNQTSTAVSNTLPGGGALGVGITYSMYGAYGFSKAEITLSVLVSGVWNSFAKLGMPVVALALVALHGEASGGFVLASVVGVAMLVAAVGAFAMVLKSDALAGRVGSFLDSVLGTIRRLLRREAGAPVAGAIIDFRHRSIGLVRERWIRLTAATILSHASLYLVLLVTLRHVGVSDAEVGWPQVLAAFAFVRLISAIPITPGGLGVVELGLSAALVAAGGDRAGVVAGVLVYRALTYFLPIPFGTLAYLRFKRNRARKADRESSDANRAAEPVL